jgi:hypothetical protein
MHFVYILMAMTLMACLTGFAADSAPLPTASPDTSGDLNLESMVQPVPSHAIFREPGSHVWCCTMAKGDDGRFHIFYSRWPKERGHRAWVTHCDVAHGVGDSPLGPFTFSDVTLPARGTEYWDGSCTHNPSVFRGKDGKYYLYHMGNRGDGKDVIPLNMVHRNNQRVGVAIADSPYGPWKRFDRPALDVSDDPNAPDALMTSNPAVCERPEGGFLMIYKGVSKPNAEHPRGVVRFFVATSDAPEGPFKKQPKEVMSETQVGVITEDPCLWRGADRYWAIMRLDGTAVRQTDGTYQFKRQGRSLALFESINGLDWGPAKHTFITDLNLKWEGEPLKPICIERPQIYLEGGKPKVLICASTEKEKNLDGSFDIFIPLR